MLLDLERYSVLYCIFATGLEDLRASHQAASNGVTFFYLLRVLHGDTTSLRQKVGSTSRSCFCTPPTLTRQLVQATQGHLRPFPRLKPVHRGIGVLVVVLFVSDTGNSSTDKLSNQRLRITCGFQMPCISHRRRTLATKSASYNLVQKNTKH